MRKTKFYKFCLFLILYFPHTIEIKGQDNMVLNTKILSVSFDKGPEKRSEKKKLLFFTKKTDYYNPFYYAGGSLLFIYQNFFSEQIQANCAYEISCSEYTKLSIQQKGFFIGVLAGFNQWSECYNGAIYEHPPAFRNNNHKIVNHFDKKIE